MKIWTKYLGLALALWCAGLGAGRAGELAQPKGPVILTISGNISNVNKGATAQFDPEMLQSLPRASFSTHTNWTVGNANFQGVPLKALLDFVGAKGKTMQASALNDYAIDMPTSDAVAGGPMIAYLLDGQKMSVRDKGPLWIIYPFDDKPEYRSEVIYSRCIWQLKAITVGN